VLKVFFSFFHSFNSFKTIINQQWIEKEKEKEKEKEEVVSEAAADIQKAAAKKIEEAEKKAKDAKAAGKSFLTGLPSEISAASVLGFCAGFYLRKTSEQIAYYVGLGVIVFQGLAYLGYVSINWNRVWFPSFFEHILIHC